MATNLSLKLILTSCNLNIVRSSIDLYLHSSPVVREKRDHIGQVFVLLVLSTSLIWVSPKASCHEVARCKLRVP